MFHIAASSRWPRSDRVTHRYVEYVARAGMNYVCSTPISCSDRDNCSTKGTFCTFKCVPGRAVYMHIPQKTQRKSVTKCLHLRVNEVDQGRHARHRKRKQKATQTECLTPPPPHTLLFIPASFVFKAHRRSLQCRLCVLWFCPISVASPRSLTALSPV